MSTFLDGAKWVFGGFTSRLSTQNLTANRTIDLPNRSGTLAMIDQFGTMADQNANAVNITGGSVSNLSNMSIFAQAGTTGLVGANFAPVNNTNVRFQFGDQYNQISSGFSKNFLFRSYHGLQFYGGGEFSAPLEPLVASSGSYNSSFHSSNANQVILRMVGAINQAGNPLEFVNSLGNVTSGINGSGNLFTLGSVQFTSTTSPSQPNNSLFLDSASGKLSFKNSTGVVTTIS